MKKAAIFIILALSMIVLALSSFSIASAMTISSYSIESVYHTVGVLYNGYVLINDTITLSGQTSSFFIGFPHAFGQSVENAFAYNANDNSITYPVALNIPQDQLGFYGARIDFSSGTPQAFSVIFVLSNNLLSQDSTYPTRFTLVFPAFPSLDEAVPVCNCSIVVPEAQYVTGTVSGFNYSAVNLAAFTYNTSQIAFTVPVGNIQILEIKQLSRQVSINEFGESSLSDTYFVANNSTNTINSVVVVVPPNASNLAMSDQLGPSALQPVLLDVNPTRYMVNFTLTVAPNATVRFTVRYNLPNNVYVKKTGNNNFALNMSQFQDTNSYIDQASVSFILPNGAHLLNYNTTLAENSYDVSRGLFQETFTVNQPNVISPTSFVVDINYEYNPLWLALYPTLEIWALAIGGGSILAVVRIKRKAPSEVAVPSTTLGGAGPRTLRPEDVRSFVDWYDEKMKIESEMDLLDTRVQKGRIPRSRYKVQKKTLEIRLNTLNKSLAEAGGRIHSAGSHYSDLMRQLEVAETEIDEVETNMKSIEARHSRGEISLETHRKLLGDYERRKEKAETTINGILLRLREETH